MSETFLPEIKQETAIVAKNTGRATPQFLRFFNVDFRGAIKRLFEGLSTTQSQQASQLEAINNALALAGLALETADAAGSAANRSGVNLGTVLSVTTMFQTVVQVDLLTVSAGDLTFGGSYLVVTPGTLPVGIPYYFEYRIIEIDNGVDNGTVFNGSATVTNTGSTLTVVDTSAVSLSAFTDARTTTGSISYRTEARTTATWPASVSCSFNLFARRAA